MVKQLKNANFPQNVLISTGKSIQLNELSSILVSKNDKFDMIYTKYFYGFEKEGSSASWSEKKVSGHIFNHTYPIDEKMFNEKIMLALNHPINCANYLLPKSTRQLEEEAKAKKDEEEALA